MSRQVQIPVEGMTCGHCTATVERSLAALDGVSDVTVRLDDGVAEATVAAEVPIERLKSAIQSAGYATPASDK